MSTVIECSEASDFRELANIKYVVHFIIFFLPTKKLFYTFVITVDIFSVRHFIPPFHHS